MIDFLFDLLKDPVFYVIFITLIPGIELRGSIPVGIAMGLDPLFVFALA
ncbi:MAG: hypothetical protein GOV15_03685, partial [Candidatus Diapherotrites archaeon]|nr:hypothetical protein [Candidatus Diapherotrites archaeon]